MSSRNWRIPFNKPFLVGQELEYIKEAVDSGQLAGDGEFTRRCENYIETMLGGSGRVFLTPSGTAALELAALLLGVGHGDEVIMPSFTFSSTANAFVLRGVRPVFVDIHPDTLNLDEGRVEEAISDKTRAIVPVHYAGVACEMDRLREIASAHDLLVVEDAAHALGSSYKNHPVGSLGNLAAFSFHETKNCISGEGGALVVNDASLVEQAEIYREKGTNRTSFFRGEVDKYTWVDVGGSFLASEIVAAFLLAQLESMQLIQNRRLEIWNRYHAELRDLETRGSLRLPIVPEHCAGNGHLFHILLGDEPSRDGLARHLAGRGILAVHHYVPLHSSPFGSRIALGGGAQDRLPLAVTEEIAPRLLRLPLYFELKDSEQDQVLEAVRDYFD